MDQSSGSLSTLVASAKTYGLVDGLQELGLTELSREYYFPLSDEGKRSAELGFLASPPAFDYLIKKFDGSRLPSPNIIANELGRNCGVSESWRGRAASFFISTAQDLGVVDAGNFLRYAAAKHSAGSMPSHTAITDDDEQVDLSPHGGGSVRAVPDAPSNILRGHAPDVRVAPINPETTSVWSHGAIRVEAPIPLTKALWEMLDLYVKLLKPDETQGG